MPGSVVKVDCGLTIGYSVSLCKTRLAVPDFTKEISQDFHVHEDNSSTVRRFVWEIQRFTLLFLLMLQFRLDCEKDIQAQQHEGNARKSLATSEMGAKAFVQGSGETFQHNAKDDVFGEMLRRLIFSLTGKRFRAFHGTIA